MPARILPTSSAKSGSIRPGVCSSCRPRRMRSTVPTTRWAPAPSRRDLSEISGHPETKWGGSVMAALQIKNIPTGPGDDIKVDASYAKGTTKNVIATSGTSPSFAMFGGSGSAYQSVGFGATTDGVYMPGVGGTGGIALTSAWGIRGAFNHNWDPYWSSSLFGGYSAVRYDGGANDNLLGAGTTSAKGAYCAAFAASHPGQALVGNADRRLYLQSRTSTSRSSAPTSAGHPSRT